ncbi:hypothetical protein, partial [Cypionkella sp.]|uniref:hypothetical protein n=1 Tax=Cypionkella sp. TaxID=2811411 RepID=UPI00271D0FAB
ARSSAAVNSFRVTSIAIRSSLPSEQENQNLNALGIPSESETMAVGINRKLHFRWCEGENQHG